MMDDEMYDRAKIQKLKELQSVIRDILAKEGDGPMDEGRVEDALEEAGEGADDSMPEDSGGEDQVDAGASDDADGMDEIAMMKRDYFKPKAKVDPQGGKGVAVGFMGKPKALGSKLAEEITLPRRPKGRV